MKIAVVQHEIMWEDPEANFNALRPQISEAAATGAELITLTETYSWGFTMNTDVAHEPEDGPSTAFLQSQAAEVGAWIVGSVPILEPDTERPNNRMVFAGPHGELHTYNKRHPFTFSGEDKSYLAGTTAKTIHLGDLRISPAICFDIRFADDFWELANDTDCYLVIANWPASRREHWRTLLRARAIENQAWVVAANRTGDDPNASYCGDSMIIDPFGEIIADAGESGPLVLHADVRADRVAQVRQDFPFLADRK